MKSKVIESYKKERLSVFNKRFGVIFNGEDNLKPLVVENIFDSSPTAFQCAWTYERFLGGAGFEVDLSKVNLLKDPFRKYTPNMLLFDCCEPVSRHSGVFVHVGYNANFEKDSFRIVPYQLCRLGEKDSNDFVGKIVVSPKGWGKSLKKDEVVSYDVYNPRPEVIAAQVERDGGWHNYKGQIAFFKLSDKYDYPTSKIELAYTFADVEMQMGLYYWGTVKRSFNDVDVIRHAPFDDDRDKDEFYNNIEKVSGVESTSSKLVLEDDFEDQKEKLGKFRFDKIKTEVQPDKYKHFEESAANYIRKAFNVPPQLVDYVSGKLGNTSGEDLIKAQSVYNAIISRDQEALEMFFAELFRNYKEDINPSGNWTIKQYSLLDDGTVNYKNNPTNGNPVN